LASPTYRQKRETQEKRNENSTLVGQRKKSSLFVTAPKIQTPASTKNNKEDAFHYKNIPKLIMWKAEIFAV